MNTQRNANVVLTGLCLAMILPVVLFAQDSPKSEVARLVAVLTSDASVFDKAKACQRLAVIGDKSAVPALAGLLTDQKLSNYARHTLEGIPDVAADRALRKAISRVDGNLLIGVLNSIAQRRDTKAVNDLKKLLTHESAAVAEAAARALGHLGNQHTAEILQDAFEKAAADRRTALAKACLICAQRRLQQNDRNRAVTLCDLVRTAKVPKHVALAATHSAILARGKEGIALLVEQLKSDDEARFRLALHAARMVDVDVSPQLIAEFGKQSPERQALLLLALGDLGNAKSVPTMIEAADSGTPEVRIQAIRVLARLGDPAAISSLLKGALHANDRVAQAARLSLADWKDNKADAAIVAMLDSRDANNRRVGIDLVARRKIAAATPMLLKLADSPDAAVRVVAVGALGSTVTLDDLPKLLAMAQAADTSAESTAAREASRAACVRMPREKCAVLLSGRLSAANAEGKVFLLEQLGVVGGPTALETVLTEARSKDDASQDAATRVLGEWLTADAAPAMFGLAKSLTNNKYKIRVLRGYIRIARQLDMPIEQRMVVCRNALRIARRTDEKVLVLEVLRRHPAPAGLTIATSLLNEAELKERACGTIVAIANRVVRTFPAEAEKALHQVLQSTKSRGVTKRAKELIAQAQESSRSN